MTAASAQAIELVALAQQELTLVRDQRDDELEQLHERREALTAMLLAAGAAAGDAAELTRAAALQQLVTLALADRAAAVSAELASLRKGRSAARGYAQTAL